MEPLNIYSIDLESPYYQMILNGKTNLKIDESGIKFLEFDPKRAYRRNSYGYRSEEFSVNADILIAGCSHTFGSGIDEHMRWGDVLTKNLNLIPQTISEPGVSISWLVEKIILHMSIFGPPKRVVCFFPDPLRASVIVDGKTLISEAEVNTETGPYNGNEQVGNFKRGQTIVHAGSEECENRNIKYIKNLLMRKP